MLSVVDGGGVAGLRESGGGDGFAAALAAAHDFEE
jgi:hypothetical protein